MVFQEALAAGHMNGFFKLIQQFTTQAEPAFCGVSSLVQVMNALEVDPKRTWKGAWRWYSEDMLDCCKPLAEIERVRTRWALGLFVRACCEQRRPSAHIHMCCGDLFPSDGPRRSQRHVLRCRRA